jgi:hypothetical protein
MKPTPSVAAIGLLFFATTASAQLDPIARNQIEFGYDLPVTGQGPQAAYAYYHYNNPRLADSNIVARVAVAPAYLDGEIGFKSLLSPHTDVGIGVQGGAFGENYYEVRQGKYWKEESFDGHGGGMSLGIYHRMNPDQMIPLSLILKGGSRYVSFHTTKNTVDGFDLPEDHLATYVRTGARFAGKEPVLYPDLAMEMSVWYEREWRSDSGAYGFAGDRELKDSVDRYWAYMGLDYAWTNTGHKLSFAATAGGSSTLDRSGAWRLGGVLPLVAEFPLILPGYYYEEITAKNFVHLGAAYVLSLDDADRWKLRFEAASAAIDYLPGYSEPDRWHTGVGAGIGYTSKNQVTKVFLRYGYGFNARRGDEKGGQSVGLLFQFDFERRRQLRDGAR